MKEELSWRLWKRIREGEDSKDQPSFNTSKTCYLSRPGLDPVTLDVYDVYFVNDHGVELKAKAPPLIGYAMFWI